MRRQIILEIEEEGTENIVADIIGMMRDKVDMNCEFRISQKLLRKNFRGKRIRFLSFFRTVVCVSRGRKWEKPFAKRREE